MASLLAEAGVVPVVVLAFVAEGLDACGHVRGAEDYVLAYAVATAVLKTCALSGVGGRPGREGFVPLCYWSGVFVAVDVSCVEGVMNELGVIGIAWVEGRGAAGFWDAGRDCNSDCVWNGGRCGSLA